jgi:hypothetical protein
MTISVTVPVMPTPEAAARIAELRLESEVERMIRHACSALPELQRVEVNLYDRQELGGDPGISIDLYDQRSYDRLSGEERNLIRWMISEFAPRVLQSIIFDYHPGNGHAG